MKIDWERRAPYALVLISVAKEQPVRQNQGNRAAIQYLLDVGWMEKDTSSGGVIPTPQGRKNASVLLHEKYPEWVATAEKMQKFGLGFNLQGLTRFREKEAQDRAKTINMTGQIHHKTFTAITKGDSKLSLTTGTLIRDDIEITHDDLIRIRPNAGLRVSRSGNSMVATEICELTGELAITDRAFRSGFKFEYSWPVRVLTVENLGFFVDLDVPLDTMVVLVEGNNTRLCSTVLDLLPREIPVFHFGDYDQKGVEIFEAIVKNATQKVEFVIPPFLQEYLSRALSVKQPWRVGVTADYSNSVIKCLVARNQRLEQELLLADTRLKEMIVMLPRASI